MKNTLYIIALIFFLGFGIGSSKTMPDNAIVYVDKSKKIYIGVPSVSSYLNKNIVKKTAKDARQLGYNPDEESKNNGDFTQEDRSLSGKLLEKIGILSPIPPRWNQNGTWNY